MFEHKITSTVKIISIIICQVFNAVLRFPDFANMRDKSVGEWWQERAVTVSVAQVGGEWREPARYGKQGRKGQ